jgi:3-hydroxy-2-methylpyridine-4,5-dicarboxylate 4-decarboxylase
MLRRFAAALLLFTVLGVTATRAETAQPSPGDPNEARIAELITASHILAHEGILDSFGHVTVRSATNPDRMFMPKAMPPALVSRADIVELDLDCKPVATDARLNGERYIHCEIYKARPDVQSVIHTHDLAVIPFGLTGTPLRAVVAQAGFLPKQTPLFDIREAYGPAASERGMLVLNPSLGHALAVKLGSNPVVLMRGHGETVVGGSAKEAAVRTIYTNVNARAQAAAMAMGGTLTAMDDAEIAFNPKENRVDRPWDNFTHRLPGGR